ncbi:GNAT family N-acetyltransferase [Arthrobacter sp. NPDC090010]|uniref:GNAT family N-acetyltransferase n=1 Tax=Arthrobacter sp. NPDC090010 TaxID=3363942 RepID=UPI00382EF6B6
MLPLIDDAVLRRPTPEDVPLLHEIYSDPEVWRHAPQGRHTSPEATQALVEFFLSCWEESGLGPWLVQDRETGGLLGNCGCSLRNDAHWNLGYRFAPAAQGRGLATRISRLAIDAVRALDDDRPVIASILEHNTASVRVAERVGLTLEYRGPDVGNPDPGAVRLLFADRRLDPAMVGLILGR